MQATQQLRKLLEILLNSEVSGHPHPTLDKFREVRALVCIQHFVRETGSGGDFLNTLLGRSLVIGSNARGRIDFQHSLVIARAY